jgi:uncharacterized protein (TIGR01777 family)
MHILITGATGLIGSPLLALLSTHSHQITVITRDVLKTTQQLTATNLGKFECLADLSGYSHFNDIDAVINLAGEPIANKRWSAAQKIRICDSRWNLTQQLVSLIAQSDSPPHTFISGSAVGYYGDQGANIIDETVKIKSQAFAHQVCARWEAIALQASSPKTRVCLLRTGVVLANQGGALAKMTPAYQLGLGGPIGTGEQYMPWIHLSDMVAAIYHILNDPALDGPINLCAPNPVQNRLFSRTLAHELHRPHWLFTPTWLIKAIMGEAAVLLTDSIRATPAKLLASSFQFQYPKLEDALNHLILTKKNRKAS